MPSAARRERTRRRLRLPEVEAPTSKILTPGRPVRPPHFEESPQTIQTGGFGALEQPRLRRNVAARRKHHADRRAVFEAGQPAGQLRIVGFDSFSANKDRIGSRPEQVGLRPRRLARDPNGLTARASRYAAIRVNRELDLNEGPPLRNAKGVPQIEPVRLFGKFAAQDLCAVRFKPSQAAPGHAHVRVERAVDNRCYAGLGHGMRAWWRRAEMAAGLKRGEHHRAARSFARLLERQHLGMRPSARRGHGAGYDFARCCVSENRADRWVGRGCAKVCFRRGKARAA